MDVDISCFTFLNMICLIVCTDFVYIGAEYCMTEIFRAECPAGQMIMMTEATFGMMERNRCVDPDDIGMTNEHLEPSQNSYVFVMCN